MNVSDMDAACNAFVRSQSIFVVIKTMETRVTPFSVRNADSKLLKTPVEVRLETNESTNIERLKKRQKHYDIQTVQHLVAKKDDEIRGHTAFLTFACKFFS